MADEVEIAALGVLSGMFRRSEPPAPPAGAVCENCVTLLQGPWCYVCGQEYGHRRRSVADLAFEAFEGMFHADGRLWKTLPRLLFRPGTLTRDYVNGKRAPQAPPFSVFLIVVVLFVFVGGTTGHQSGSSEPVQNPAAPSPAASTFAAADDSSLAGWIKTREQVARAQPERFAIVAETWEHRLAIVMLPISTLILAALFAFNKRFLVHDHLVFSMHSLAFAGLVLSACMILALALGDWAVWLWVLLPIHLFFHMRGFYRASVPGTLVRMAFFYVGTSISYVLLLFVLVMFSLAAMTA